MHESLFHAEVLDRAGVLFLFDETGHFLAPAAVGPPAGRVGVCLGTAANARAASVYGGAAKGGRELGAPPIFRNRLTTVVGNMDDYSQ
jgi:hypothetical protein